MGNPKNVTVGAAPDLAGAENGIFALVPGEHISAGSHTLPPASSMPGQTAVAVVDGGHVGLVRITYRSQQFKHHRSSHWAWTPLRVDRAVPGETAP